MTSRKAIYGYLLCVAMFLCGIFSLLDNRAAEFEEFHAAANAKNKNGQLDRRALALNSEFTVDELVNIFSNGCYIPDEKDARMAAYWIHKKVKSADKISNLGTLLKENFKIPADSALRLGGKDTKLRVENDLFLLGQDSEYQKLNLNALSSAYGDDTDENARISIRLKSKVPGRSGADVPVRLREHYVKKEITISDRQDTTIQESIADSTVAWVKTDANGSAKFHVPKGRYYSVVPINRGYQYGKAKGTTSSELNGNLDLGFTEKIHTLTPISRSVFNELKADDALTARTPADFKSGLFIGCLIYILGWALALLYVLYIDYRLKTTSDYLLIIILMALTAIGMFAWYSITDPLTDILHGSSMSVYLCVGIVAFMALCSVNYVKFYYGQSQIQPKNKYSWLLNVSQNKGRVFLGAALALFALLALFGTGPEGSVAKVNLGPIQPSEICKFLILAFIAAYFAENYSLIQKFSEKATATTVKRKLTVMSVIVAAMALLMLVYFYLSDHGPAIVLLFTFILLYSVIRGDIGKMLIGVFTFAVTLIIAWFVSHSMLVLSLAALAWYAGWAVYCKKQHTIYESAIFMNLIPLLYILMNSLLGGNEGARMSHRTGMAWSGVWDNAVPGGDQIAQGLWGVASGGMTGMGLGNGSPESIPACHTDMAFLSIGEMLGFVGLILVVLCMFALIHRTLLIGRKAGNPFVMFLVMGLGITTGVQFLVIVFGSLGLFPLTGINVPFLSQGGVSLIMMLAVYGVTMSASRLQTTDAQKDNARKFQGAVAAGALIFMGGAIVIIATLANYQLFNKSNTLLRPAFITNLEGARVVEYNPRINQIMRRLDSGTIYDRNGLILATSFRDSIASESQIKMLKDAGVSTDELNAITGRRQHRYYPFGNHTLFMVGDANTRKVYGYYDSNPIGYLAEYRHLSELKGIEVPTWTDTLYAESYKSHRFMGAEAAQFKVTCRDYTVLLPFLEHDVHNNPFIERHNAKRPNRDITLTIDAKLQVLLQNALKNDSYLSGQKGLRASVVVLDSRNGDLLASANYPLPEQDSIAMLNERKIYGDVPFEKIKGHKAITERDLGITFQSFPGSTAKVMSGLAGFMKDGPEIGSEPIKINPKELIEPPGYEPEGNVLMEKAIVMSSNCYFIKLVHDNNLYPQLEELYSTVGARLHHNETNESLTPYYFHMSEAEKVMSKYSELVKDVERSAMERYNRYKNRSNQTKYEKMNWWQTGVAWGQGSLRATPLNMARVASIVANEGVFVPTRYVLKRGEQTQNVNDGIEIVDSKSANLMKGYMQKESDRRRNDGHNFPKTADRMGGKTGTAERPRHGQKLNDAWYICFINSETTGTPLAVALRIERTRKTSGQALKTMANAIIPAIESAGYKVK